MMVAFKLAVVILMMTTSSRSSAQAIKQSLTVHYAGLGAYSKNFSDVFSGTSNQASLASLKSAAFAAYGERRFMLDELNGYTAIVAVPTGSGTIGFAADYFGSSHFNESELGIVYARKITSHVDLGVKFNYHSMRVSGYGTASAVTVEAGAIFHLTDKLHTGFHVYNPGGSRLGKTGTERLSSRYAAAFGYEASDKVFVSTEIVKCEDQPLIVNAGLQYNLHERALLRAGISAGSNNSYFSIGLNVGFGRIDVNTAYHPQLGFTPGVLLLIHLKKFEGE